METIEEVMDRLALLSDWGARSHVSVAEIPAGVSVKFLHGRAALKNGIIDINESRSGESIQYCFEIFDEAWIKASRELP
jgi:hypothetical protein